MTASKHHLKDKYKSARDNETLQTICDEHKDLSAEIEEKANQIFEMQHQVIDIKEKLGDFMIWFFILT